MGLTRDYYDLVTSFYEYGWGDSFHFAPLYRDKSFLESIRLHQTYLADRLDVQPGMRVLDIGCGIGGPLVAIAQYTGAVQPPGCCGCSNASASPPGAPTTSPRY